MRRTPASLDDWIHRYLREEAPKSKSLMVSVFGDSIAPAAPGLWLGELITLLAPLGMNERLVRTSAFRLVEEGWLEARRDGRRSFYSLTPSGTRRFEVAYARIYTPPQRDWDGAWTVLFLPRNGEGATDRVELRRELEWQGFASPTPGVLLHPSPNADVLHRSLEELGIVDRAIALRARSLENFSSESVHELMMRCWDLAHVRTRYDGFLARFEPLLASLPGRIPPDRAFMVQTLMIHSFRRAILHDPHLPVPLLPADWPGLRAYALCRDLYQRTYRSAQQHLKAVAGAEEDTAAPPRLSMSIRERFGGLT